MLNGFAWDKHEVRIHGRVDWGVTRTPALRDAHRAMLTDWPAGADAVLFLPARIRVIELTQCVSFRLGTRRAEAADQGSDQGR